jgi:quercetin 2,3-dioxygenase
MELHHFDCTHQRAWAPTARPHRAFILHSAHPYVRVEPAVSRCSLPEGSHSPMIAVRKAEERQRQRASRRLTLRAAISKEVTLGLFDLWLPPGQRIELELELSCELLTYVVTGTLAHALGAHTRAVLGPNELQCLALGLETNIAHTQTNPSPSEASHVVQLLVHDPRRTLELRQAQRRLSFAQRRGLLCAVAGPDPAAGVLPLQSEITLYSSVLDPGQHIVHGFASAHSGILHVVSGELSVAGHVLGPGDTVHARAERSLAFTAREHAEVLLGDVHGLTSF